jgi:plastocyanin
MKARWLVLAPLAGLAVPFIVPALAADHNIAVSDSQFSPATTTIGVGDTVTWSDASGGLPHNVKFDDGSFEEPMDPKVGPWTADRTFDTDGTFRYECELHGPSMSGRIVVGTGGTTSQPTNTGTNTTPTNTGTTPTGTNTTGTTTQPTGGGTDTTDPSIAALRRGASTFCTRRSRTCRRPGLVFRLELSEPAELRGVVRRVGRARGAATRRSFTRAGKAGQNVVRVPARGLRRGRYRLTLRAVDASGNSSAPRGLSFTLRR